MREAFSRTGMLVGVLSWAEGTGGVVRLFLGS